MHTTQTYTRFRKNRITGEVLVEQNETWVTPSDDLLETVSKVDISQWIVGADDIRYSYYSLVTIS